MQGETYVLSRNVVWHYRMAIFSGYFPNISFLGVYFSNISEDVFFSVYNFPVSCKRIPEKLMGKDKDFSVFVKSGHILYCFFLCCLFPFESIR